MTDEFEKLLKSHDEERGSDREEANNKKLLYKMEKDQNEQNAMQIWDFYLDSHVQHVQFTAEIKNNSLKCHFFQFYKLHATCYSIPTFHSSTDLSCFYWF